MTPSDYLGSIMVEADSIEEAQRRVEAIKNCPNLIAVGAAGKTVYSIHA